MKNRLIIYGAGKYAKTIYEQVSKYNIDIEAIIDTNPQKWGEKFEDYIIQSPKQLMDYENAYLFIAIKNQDAYTEVVENLSEFKGKVISYKELMLLLMKSCEELKFKINFNDIKKEESYIFDCSAGLILGGVESWTQELCGALIKDGIKNTYILSKVGKYRISNLLEDHILYVDLNENRFSEVNLKKIMNEIVKKLPCKIITMTTDAFMIAAYMIKCQYPNLIEIVSVIHNSHEYTYREYLEFQDCVDIFIAVSQDIRNDMIAYGINEKKFYTMTCPFECEEYLERTYTIDENKPIRIGYAGRMDGFENSQKRMDLLLKCLEYLVELDANFTMNIAGDGAARAEMERYIYTYRLSSKVKFLGTIPHSEINKFWQQQDICVNFADFEGRSISIIEAMGNGAIPIVTATSGTKEDIISGHNGYIVPLRDYKAIAEHIQYLEKHRELLVIMGNKSHASIYPKSLMQPHLTFWKEKILKVRGQ